MSCVGHHTSLKTYSLPPLVSAADFPHPSLCEEWPGRKKFSPPDASLTLSIKGLLVAEQTTQESVAFVTAPVSAAIIGGGTAAGFRSTAARFRSTARGFWSTAAGLGSTAARLTAVVTTMLLEQTAQETLLAGLAARGRAARLGGATGRCRGAAAGLGSTAARSRSGTAGRCFATRRFTAVTTALVLPTEQSESGFCI